MYPCPLGKGEFDVPSRGLGDTVKKILHKTGVAKIVKKLNKKQCGCDKRQDKLNAAVPYKKV